jgi:diguanylate cyclase (GGDEF)-like protein
MPFSISHKGSRDEFTADQIAVVSAALLLSTRAGVLVIALGYALGSVLRREAKLYRLDDLNNIIIGAFLALTLAHTLGPPGLSLGSIAGAVLAGLFYDPFTLLTLTVWTVLAKRVGFWSFFRAGMASSVISYPWIISLGILISTIGWDAPWALPLLGAPLALVFMASRSRVAATEDRTRLDGLLKATTEILAATTVNAVTIAATNAVASIFESGALLEGQVGRIDKNGPQEGELGIPLTPERMGSLYLIAPARSALARAYTEDDQRLLETLASVTTSALDKAALHEDVTEQATRDALTGLANRRTFETELQSSAIGKRSSDASGVMFLDLDGFKKINDEHGHKAGDEVLIETAKRLLQSVRDSDTVARLGGDEFTILLRGVHNRDEAAIIAERILTAMRRPIALSTGVYVHPTPSLGIALATGHAREQPVALLKDADSAMYEAKRAGKNCWRLAQSKLNMAVEQ